MAVLFLFADTKMLVAEVVLSNGNLFLLSANLRTGIAYYWETPICS